MFKKILIANRGEIACRIIKTCQRLGVLAVAVYSEADSDAYHVKLADEAYCIGKAPPQDSYLNIDSIIDIAKTNKVEAIHPGYGFLSENGEFSTRCRKAGIVFIGPSTKSIEQMGSKSQAKTIMSESNVPIVPGYHGENQDSQFLKEQADNVGYPLMIKPVAGGGGKGMRLVQKSSEFLDLLESSKRESMKAFGDDVVLLERFVTKPRHIEFQIFGDQHGNVVHLFERECSIQRRHQKIIEETPSVFLDQGLRSEMGYAAVTAANAIQYEGAGTVEFIIGEDRQFYFLEMNTRLQVEHPVTEMTTGIDLVEWQLRVASGEELPLKQEDIKQKGHAIEARIYAENPQNQFLPSTGKLSHWIYPPTNQHFRLDTGFLSGDTITIHYDPMLAKFIVWDEDRAKAIQQLKFALSQSGALGIDTNISFLEAITHHPDFLAGKINTLFVDSHLDRLLEVSEEIPEIVIWAATIAQLLNRELLKKVDLEHSHDPDSPWNQLDSWRLNHQKYEQFNFQDIHNQERTVKAFGEKGTYTIQSNDQNVILHVENHGNNKLTLCYAGRKETLTIFQNNNAFLILHKNGRYSLTQIDPFDFEDESSENEGDLVSPMPGQLIKLLVSEGESVKHGQTLIILEAMKMEHTIQASQSGVIKKINYQEGDLVDGDVILITFE